MPNLGKSIIAGLLALSSLGLFSSAAFAYGTNLTIRNAAGNDEFCMDASMDHREQDGDKVYVYKCHGRENQRWDVTHDTNGQSLLVGLGGYCLDVRGAHTRANGTPVELWQCHYGKNQRFNVTPTGQIKEVESGKCLMAISEQDRAAVVLDTCMHKPTEIWHFKQ
jgi:methionyl-tRNA formyltransferase